MVLQPSQQKSPASAADGAIASSPAAQKGGLPDNDLATDDSRMQRSTSGARAAGADGKGTKA